jgi:hypothetical protein
MSFYKLVFDDQASGAVADTFKTVAALIAADTAGYRCRIRSLQIGPADDTPSDANIAVRLNCTDNAGAGTPGASISGANIPKTDPDSVDSVISGATGYTVEPTTYATQPLWQMDMNVRGGFIKEWDIESAPVVARNTTLGLLIAPRAASAQNVSGTIEFEVF